MKQTTTLSVGLGLVLALCMPASFAQEEVILEELVVTGTYIKRKSQFDSPSPLTSLGLEDLAAFGVNEISDVIEDLTINTGSQNNPDAFTQNFTTGTSNVNLRGLGVSSTLVLINGRRQTQSAGATDRGENFVDTSSLPPMIAFDRIETLKDGATALYGSDAVAGVVNFITRSDFDGFDLEVGYQTTDQDNQEDIQISGAWGVGNDTTHWLAAFSYLDRSPLTSFDRRLSQVTDDLSQAGNPGAFLIPTTPANPPYALVWTAVFDTNLNGLADFLEPGFGLPAVPGALQPVFADPDCTTIAAQDPKVVPLIVQSVPSPIGDIGLGACGFDFGDFFSIVPEEEKLSTYLELDHDFSDRVSGRVEFHYATNEALRNNSPSFPFARFPTVPATHPDNPFGTDVLFIGRVLGAGATAKQSTHDSDTTRFAAELTGDFNDTWGWNIGVQYSNNDFELSVPDVLVDRFNSAIVGLGSSSCDAATGTPGAGPCEYFNPFGTALTGTGTVNSQAVIDDLLGLLSVQAENELTTFDVVINGEFGELPGGTVGVAFGAQYRDEELSYDYDDQSNQDNFLFLTGNPDFSATRDVSAFFVELALPLSSTLDLQLAARYEDYEQTDSTDPKLTLLWRPTDELSLRASFGTAFRAPSLFQTAGTQTSLAELVDPLVGFPQFFPVRSQPNPSGAPLQPEQADVLNFGVSWSVTDNFRVGFDYWSFDYDNVIIQQNPQAILNAAAAGNPQAASQVIRQAGLLIRVDSFYDNASTLETNGFDLLARYDLDAAGGTFAFGVEATFVTTYDLVDPQAGAIDGAGKRNFGNFATSVPELRANGFLNWTRDQHNANLFLRFIDSYTDDQVGFGQGPEAFESIDSQVTVDANYSYRLDFANFTPIVTVGAINLLDEDPPRVTTNGGYDSKVHDPRGRLWFVKAAVQFD